MYSAGENNRNLRKRQFKQIPHQESLATERDIAYMLAANERRAIDLELDKEIIRAQTQIRTRLIITFGVVTVAMISAVSTIVVAVINSS